MRDFELTGSRSEPVRPNNLAAVLRTLHLGGPAAHAGLVAATGLTRRAIGALVGELGALGFGLLLASSVDALSRKSAG